MPALRPRTRYPAPERRPPKPRCRIRRRPAKRSQSPRLQTFWRAPFHLPFLVDPKDVPAMHIETHETLGLAAVLANGSVRGSPSFHYHLVVRTTRPLSA